ncbi:MAG TPA: class I SAM-dependent methyltransferase [Xanthobacteraceae bacterium]
MLHSANPGTHSFADRGHDCYSTPPEAVRALLEVEQLPHVIWEPACGPGAIVQVLREAGHAVIASDVIEYPTCSLHFRRDFLMETRAPAGVGAIVTNPPFRHADAFVAHALELVPLAAMLLRLAFLESERRSPILDTGKLARIHVFRNRLPMMHRAGWEGPRASSSIPFAWFVWNRNHAGPATVDRISHSKPGA